MEWLGDTRPQANDDDTYKDERQVSTTKKRELAPKCTNLWPSLPSTSLLARKAIRWLQSTGKEHSLYIHIPSRVGHSPCLDLALTANMDAHGVDMGDKNLSEEHCYHTSTLATGALQTLLKTGRGATSDEAMLTVALLFSFESSVRAWSVERMRGPVDQAASLHMRGLAALFTSRPPTGDVSPLYRAVWYATSFYVAFIIQLFSPENSSPFERAEWLDLEPPVTHPDGTLPDHLRSLLKISNKLFISLPRLTKLSQRARRDADQDTQQAALKVATALYTMHDTAAENHLLHNVNVIPTPETSSPGKNLIPYTFKFPSVPAYEAALAYWTTRLFVLRQLHNLLSTFPTLSLLGASDLENEASRTAKNIMMSWEAIRSHKAITKMRGSVALQAVWGILGQFTVAKGEMEGVRGWLLERANELSVGSCVLTGGHLDGFAALQGGEGVWMPQMGALSC